MKDYTKEIITLIIAVISSLAVATGIWQLTGGNVAIQIGGTQNKIEQKVETHSQQFLEKRQ
jgi:hypothetical protein